MKTEDKQALLEVLDDKQTKTIRKAGIHRPFKLNCSTVVISNPLLEARWDPTKSIEENTGFNAPFFSRFDAIFLFDDAHDAKEDEAIFDHYSKHYTDSIEEQEYDKLIKEGKIISQSNSEYYSTQEMAAYIRYVRKKFHPKVEEGSAPHTKMKNFYLRMRNSAIRKDPSLEGENNKNVGVRMIGSLMRFARSSARTHCRHHVTMKDADEAIEIVNTSIVNSGFNPATEQEQGRNIIATRGLTLDEIAAPQYQAFRKLEAQHFSIFKKELKKAAWEWCESCKKQGYNRHVLDLGEGQFDMQDETCDNCNGNGGWYRLFDKEAVSSAMWEKLQFPKTKFMSIFELAAKQGIFERQNSGLWKQTRALDDLEEEPTKKTKLDPSKLQKLGVRHIEREISKVIGEKVSYSEEVDVKPDEEFDSEEE